jgi:hypothetical protein
MEPYLIEHYAVVGNTSGGFQFLERKSSPVVVPKTTAISAQVMK